MIRNPTDSIFIHPSITEVEKKLVKSIFDTEVENFKKNTKGLLFRYNEEREFVNEMEFLIKALLQHKINNSIGEN